MKNRGFSLVEVLVGVTVLALLAAISIIPLMSYIDKANQQRAIIETRSIVLASRISNQIAYLQLEKLDEESAKELIEFADVDGKIIELIKDDNEVRYLHYLSNDNIEVIYDLDWKNNHRNGIYSVI